MYDVLVVGGGNAALCAAISARLTGSTVLVLEAAPQALRGGNSRHTRNLRCMHEGPADLLTGSYPLSEYFKDLLQVTGGRTNEKLALMTLRESSNCQEWMRQKGVRFQRALGGTLHLSRTNAFFLGGGKALLNAYYRAAAAMGVEIEYDAEVRGLDIRDGRFHSATVLRDGGTRTVRARALVAASGGYQGNLEWLKEVWGDAADNFIIRGTPYDTGTVLRGLMDCGVKTAGDPAQCHAVAVDARSPRFDGGIVTRVDCVSLGIVVNRDALRFYDEGEDFWPKRYAVWGRLIAEQPDQIAHAIIDAKSMGLFVPPLYPPHQAGSLPELAALLTLAPEALERTVAAFNASVQPGTFDHAVLDDNKTEGLNPPKSHWARPLDTPPFFAYPLRPGITFTYLGVEVDEKARVVMKDDKPAENVFAAGEIMAGNILGQGYLAGIGMTIGTVFGRIAGEEASRVVHG
ncbi:MAG: FAD-dependent tricarballylate dehydrogenase TcuA [Vicinamibacteria bacterium]|nr:FAD-dependent tricarballylate dehydrogenase TcuA [Vicinamibacteria bacterium]